MNAKDRQVCIKKRFNQLGRMLRNGERTIFADNGVSLAQEIERHGQRTDQVFFKYMLWPTELGKKPEDRYRNALPYLYRTKHPFSLDSEFRLLSIMHEALPENIPEPIAVVKGNNASDGPVIGYLARRIDGVTLHDELNTVLKGSKAELLDIGPDFLDQVKRLTEILNHLHRNQIGHGDPATYNIIVEQTGAIKLIDPLPWLENGAINMRRVIDSDKVEMWAIDLVAGEMKKLLDKVNEAELRKSGLSAGLATSLRISAGMSGTA